MSSISDNFGFDKLQYQSTADFVSVSCECSCPTGRKTAYNWKFSHQAARCLALDNAVGTTFSGKDIKFQNVAACDPIARQVQQAIIAMFAKEREGVNAHKEQGHARAKQSFKDAQAPQASVDSPKK